MSVGYYNNSLFVIGGASVFCSKCVHVATLDDLEHIYDSEDWITSNWHPDTNYGSLIEIAGNMVDTIVDENLYMAGSNQDGIMLIYNMKSQIQVNSSTYAYSMPNKYQAACVK